MVLGVHVGGESQLAAVAGTTGLSSLLPGPTEHREEYCGEDGYDRYDYEQLNERCNNSVGKQKSTGCRFRQDGFVLFTFFT